MSKELITKHNALIEASYRLTMGEVRLILYGISLVNPVHNDFPSEYVINIDRYAELFNLDKNHLYQEVKNIARKKLFRREFSYTLADGKTRITSWLSAIDYEDQTGYVKLHFPLTLKPLLHQLKENFTTYYIEQIANFKSIYSVRLYEQAIMKLNKYKKNKTVYIDSIEEIKKRLGIEDKYKEFFNFKARVLEKSKKEINKFSDIKISYNTIKKGRAVCGIKFTASHKEKNKEQQLLLINKTEINLSPSIIEMAKSVLEKKGCRLDIYTIIAQFKAYSLKKGAPENIEGAFLGFVKKKTEF